MVPGQLVPIRIPSALSVLAVKTLGDVGHVGRRLRKSRVSWFENMSVSMALSPTSLDVGSIANWWKTVAMAAEISQSSRTALVETHKEQDGEMQGATIWKESIRRAKGLCTSEAFLANHRLVAEASALRTAFSFEEHCSYTTDFSGT